MVLLRCVALHGGDALGFLFVIPAQAGIQCLCGDTKLLGPGFCRGDEL